MTTSSVQHAGVCVVAASVLSFVSGTVLGEQAQQPLEAVWRSQQVQLAYRGEHTFYSCRELATRVTTVLVAIGARADVQIQTRCDDFARTQLLTIALATPVEATPENVRLLTTYDATHRLLAEVRRESLPSATDVQRFPAEWRTISLRKVGPLRFGNSDCQLLRTLNEQVFPKLDVHVRKGGLSCASQATAIEPTILVQALVARASREPAFSG